MVDAVSSGSAAQAGNVKSQVATQVLKAQIDADRSVVKLLESTQSSSSANLEAGVGGNVDKSA